jgi:hypothetical protein
MNARISPRDVSARLFGSPFPAHCVTALRKYAATDRGSAPLPPGAGWFLAFRCYTKYVQLQFFRGTSLDPVPPKASKHDEVRYFDISEDDDLDEDQLVSWTGKQPARREDVESPPPRRNGGPDRQLPRTGTTARSLTGAPESAFGADEASISDRPATLIYPRW